MAYYLTNLVIGFGLFTMAALLIHAVHLSREVERLESMLYARKPWRVGRRVRL